MALTDQLVAYWKLDENAGTSFADASGNGQRPPNQWRDPIVVLERQREAVPRFLDAHGEVAGPRSCRTVPAETLTSLFSLTRPAGGFSAPG